MPLALTVTPEPSVRPVAQRGTLWHRLYRLAVQAIRPCNLLADAVCRRAPRLGRERPS